MTQSIFSKYCVVQEVLLTYYLTASTITHENKPYILCSLQGYGTHKRGPEAQMTPGGRQITTKPQAASQITVNLVLMCCSPPGSHLCRFVPGFLIFDLPSHHEPGLCSLVYVFYHTSSWKCKLQGKMIILDITGLSFIYLRLLHFP